jgi:hypothetical protein
MGDSAIDVFAFESPRRPNLFGSRWKGGRISRKASKVLKKIEGKGKNSDEREFAMEQTCKVFTCCIASNRYQVQQRKFYTCMELIPKLGAGKRDNTNDLRFQRLRIFTFCDTISLSTQ